MKQSVFLQIVCKWRGHTILKVILTIFLLVALLQPSSAFAASQGVTLSGNKFLLNGQEFVPRGFNSIAFLYSTWCTNKTTQTAANNFTSSELTAAKTVWNANTLRFQVSQPVLAGPNGAAYAQQIQTNVTTARNAGFVVDLSMQDQSLACGPAQPLPSQETETAWATLLNNTSLSSDPGIMFEVFNEPDNTATTTATTDPQQSTWVDWQNGGRQLQPTSSQTWTAYTPIGHQDLVNYLRNTLHVTNVLIVDGAQYAEHLEGMPILTDQASSYQIAYALHPYYYTPGMNAWNTRWGYLAPNYALIATEWNYKGSDCGTSAQTMAPQFLSYMRNTINVGILGHALDNYNNLLIANAALTPTQCGTPTPGGGYDFLNSYMATFSPVPSVPPSLTPTPTLGNQIDTTAPSTPTGLTANATNPTEVDLSWQAASDNVAVTGYKVYRNGTLLTTLGTSTLYQDTSVSENTPYTYTISAIDAAGNESSQSVGVTITTPAAPDTSAPSIPTNVTATMSNTNQVSISWTASTDNVGVAGYYLYRDGTQIATVTNGTSYTDTGLADSTTYQYSASAFDAAGNASAQSSAASVTTHDITPPGTPTGLTVTATSPHQVTLSWQASTDNVGVTGYNIYRNTTEVATVLGANATTFTDVSLADATTYSYTVTAIDAAGNESTQSTSVSATTPDGTAPTIPANLTVSLQAPNQASINWTASTDNVGVSGYNLYRNGTKIANITNGTTYLDTNLSDATTYKYAVAAYDAAGNVSSQSATASITTPDTTAPSVPTGLTAQSASTSQINISWTASSDNIGVTGYTVYRNGTQIAATSGTTYNDTGLKDATTYVYTIAAYDAAHNTSAQSTSVSATTPDGTSPSVPANIALSLASTSITIAWSASTDNVGVSGYTIYRNGTKLATTNQLTYSDTAVSQGKIYQYTVAAYDAAGNTSAQSSTQSITFPDTTPPTAPSNLKATVGTQSVSLSWTPSTDNIGVVNYSVWRNGKFLVWLSGTTTSYSDKGLTSGATYSYFIYAIDVAKNRSAASNTVFAKAK